MHSQSLPEINAVLGIPDSLEHLNEVRLYKSYSTTNATDVFRMYLSKREGYKMEYYQYRHSVAGIIERPYFNKIDIAPASDPEYIWMSIIASNILYLPQEEVFKYKQEIPNIVCEDGRYAYSVTTMAVSDGTGYIVCIRDGNLTNVIEYSNPESYLRRYPKIDELDYFVQFINLIKNEFSIWADY